MPDSPISPLIAAHTVVAAAVVEHFNDPALNPSPASSENSPVKVAGSAELDRASGKAVQQYADEGAAREKRKKGGRPRKYPPAPASGGGSVAVPETDSPAENESVPSPLGTPPVSQPATLETPQAVPFDEKTYKELVKGVIGMMNDFAVALMGVAVKRLTKDPAIIIEAQKSARMSDTTEAIIEAGAMGCVRKYCVNFGYAPEVALVVGVGIWSMSSYTAYRIIVADYRPAPKQPRAFTPEPGPAK
jgi:hypothetical protein